jgi:hypothetical protein
MILKYLQGNITIKGLALPTAAVKCMSVSGSETTGAWVGALGLYGNIETAKEKTDFWLEKIDMVLMMDGYQPNNVEEKVNIFEYFLKKLKTMDARFADFELKDCEHMVTFTSPPSSKSPTLLDPVLAQLNPLVGE